MGVVKTWRRAFQWWCLTYQYHKKRRDLKRKEKFLESVYIAYMNGDITEDEMKHIFIDKGYKYE